MTGHTTALGFTLILSISGSNQPSVAWKWKIQNFLRFTINVYDTLSVYKHKTTTMNISDQL